jgi:RNA polymerase sigma factor (sigma-70 family)
MSDSPRADSTRPSLLLRLRDASDAQAWNTFVDVYGPLIFGRCRRKGLKHEDAEDVSQRIFAKITAAIRGFDYEPAKGRFRDWLGTVVNGEINRFFRRNSRQEKGLEHPDNLDNLETNAEDAAWTEEFNSQVLRTALARCRPHFEDATWQAIELVWIENQSAAHAANVLQQTIASIYVAKSRVLKRLWQEVQELADDVELPWNANLGLDNSS